MFLKNASITQTENEVIIICEFADDYPEASCVLVYRVHDDNLLTVIEYSHTTPFPVSVTLGRYEQSTFSIFGKSGENRIDSRPFTARLIVAMIPSPSGEI